MSVFVCVCVAVCVSVSVSVSVSVCLSVYVSECVCVGVCVRECVSVCLSRHSACLAIIYRIQKTLLCRKTNLSIHRNCRDVNILSVLATFVVAHSTNQRTRGSGDEGLRG